MQVFCKQIVMMVWSFSTRLNPDAKTELVISAEPPEILISMVLPNSYRNNVIISFKKVNLLICLPLLVFLNLRKSLSLCHPS